jgi:hypothetical protein
LIFLSIFLGTGEDDTAEDEGTSPTKKTKGKPGRKVGQTNKTSSKKDTDQEAENSNHQPYSKLNMFTKPFQLPAMMLKMKVHHLAKQLKVKLAVNQDKKQRIRIKTPRMKLVIIIVTF